jgi:hypothetical protein
VFVKLQQENELDIFSEIYQQDCQGYFCVCSFDKAIKMNSLNQFHIYQMYLCNDALKQHNEINIFMHFHQYKIYNDIYIEIFNIFRYIVS